MACLGAVTVAAVSATCAWTPRPMLVWNASASSPQGLYLVTGARDVKSGDMLVAWPPAAARALAAKRGYLPANIPLVKRVAAIAGSRACANGGRIAIDGRRAAIRKRADRHRRSLPWWTGCRRLAGGEVLLLSRAGPASFDGRYFGPTRPEDIVGRARLLWPR